MAIAATITPGPRGRFLDLEILERTPLGSGSFPYLIVPGFVSQSARIALGADFPKIDKPGSFPVDDLSYGSAFAEFLRELRADDFRAVIERKFSLDLARRPTLVTVRGHARAKDGRIHKDSRTKLVTVLIYMNEAWEAKGGRLRLLYAPNDLEQAFAEVPPEAGTLLAFRVTRNSWHGHGPVEGERRVIQLNWVENQTVVRRERARHGLSARVKRFVTRMGGH